MGLRIAMVGPWPPKTSGIADYAADLADQLGAIGIELTRIGEPVDAAPILASLAAQDVVVYQMGNHAGHHAWMLPLMAQVPGIVHLHDMVLHHLVAIAMEHHGQLTPDSYARILDGWYPPRAQNGAVAALECGLPIWAKDSVALIPLFEPVVRMATDVVVHSEFAARALRNRFPYVPVHVIPQRYTHSGNRRQRSRLHTISIVGSGEPNRRFDWVAEALERIHDQLSGPLTLEIAGQINPAVEEDIARIARLDKIELKMLGRVDDQSFEAAIQRGDMLIAFRHPTMGETSAIVSKALQNGLPTIVSNQGWYSELPDCVHKIGVGDSSSTDLAEFILKQLNSPDMFAEWGRRCHVESEHHVLGARQSARMYAAILAKSAGVNRLRGRVADHLSTWDIDPDGAFAGHLASIDVQCSFPERSMLHTVLAAASRDMRRTMEEEPDHVAHQPLAQGNFRCHMEIESLCTEAPSETTLEIMVNIRNMSEVTYASPKPSQPAEFGIFIGYHWHMEGKDDFLQENPRTRLVEPIAPGEEFSQVMRVKTPAGAGDYELVVDLVQEQVAWFRHMEGSPAILPMRIDMDAGCNLGESCISTGQ